MTKKTENPKINKGNLTLIHLLNILQPEYVYIPVLLYVFK